MFKPVKITTPESSDPKLISTLPEATEFIIAHWPAYRSVRLEEAREICLDAVSGKVPVNVARAAFVAAAKEAGIYVHHSKIKNLVAAVVGTEEPSLPAMTSTAES
jgi:hypothetical protein